MKSSKSSSPKYNISNSMKGGYKGECIPAVVVGFGTTAGRSLFDPEGAVGLENASSSIPSKSTSGSFCFGGGVNTLEGIDDCLVGAESLPNRNELDRLGAVSSSPASYSWKRREVGVSSRNPLLPPSPE